MPYHYWNSPWQDQITIGTNDRETRENPGEAGGPGIEAEATLGRLAALELFWRTSV
jgi:hypothetical protein